MKPSALIAGIGNIFHGDDGFGVAVAQRLMTGGALKGARVCDFGIRGIDLVFAFLEGYDLVILADAMSRGEEPGTIYVIEPDLTQIESNDPAQLNGHNLDPWQVLQQAARMGAKFGRVVVVGCEPASIDPGEDGRMGLSPPVETAVDAAVAKIQSLAAEFFTKECVA